MLSLDLLPAAALEAVLRGVRPQDLAALAVSSKAHTRAAKERLKGGRRAGPRCS